MPKIIKNLPQRLIEAARRQISENGYASLTIRSAANACGVGTGTVYNYFPSKDALIVAFMLEDWHECLAAIEAVQNTENTALSVLQCMHRELCGYIQAHQALFRDKDAAASFSASLGKYHALLRSQLSTPLLPFCQSEFEAEFLAEALLTWTAAGKGFEEIFTIIKKLL